MNNISLRSLMILDALVEHKTIAKAAEVLGLSYSKACYALNKLREQTGHALFTRSKDGMVPDNYAIDLQQKYLKISTINNTCSEFILATHSPIELLIGHQLSLAMIDDFFIRFTTMPASDDERLLNLRNRTVDIDIGGELSNDSSIVSFPWLEDDICIMVSQNHETINEQFTINDWYDNEHIAWLREGEDFNNIVESVHEPEIYLERRNVVYKSANVLSMAHLCAGSNKIMLIPKKVSRTLENIYPVKTYPLPWGPSSVVKIYIHHHRSLLKNADSQAVLNFLFGLE